MFDLIGVGDITLDVFMNMKDAELHCDINKKACKLCVGFGDKVPIDSITNIYGVGNAPNVAVGVSRLGMKSAMYGVLGNDYVGKEMYHVLKHEGVATDYLRYDKKNPSDYSVVLMYNGDRTILVYHETRAYRLPAMKKSHWLFLGSIGQDPTQIHKQVLDYINKHNVKLAFNPGPVQQRQGLKKLKPLFKNTEVLFLNKEEAQRILETRRGIKSLSKELYTLGVKIVVITDGAEGSYVYDGEKFYHANVATNKVFESTGCGDAYATGFIAALHTGQSIEDALKWGTCNAGSVLQYLGAQEGLLNRSKIKTVVKKTKSLQVKIT